MKKRVLSILMCMCMMTTFIPSKVFAWKCPDNVKVLASYDSSILKEITASFSWHSADAYCRLVLMSNRLRSAGEEGTGVNYGDFTDMGFYGRKFNSFNDVLAYDKDTEGGTNGTFGIISYSDETEVGAGKDNTMTISFENNPISLDKDQTLYIYCWTKYEGKNYPDMLICAMKVKDGEIKCAAANGRNEYDDNGFKKVELISKKHKYDGNAYDLSSLFNTALLGTDVVYTIETDSTGVGTINGSSLTITKTGIFNIKASSALGEQKAVLTVEKGTHSIEFPTASQVTYGSTLENSVLSGGSTFGTFSWSDKTIIPKVSNSGYDVTFTPNDTNLYEYETADLTRKVGISVLPLSINKKITLTVPVKGETPQTSITEADYTAEVLWSPEPEDGKFAKNTEYTAKITITLRDADNYTFNTIEENGYEIEGAKSVTNAEKSNILMAVFPKTKGNSGSSGSSATPMSYTVKFDTKGGSAIAKETVTKNSKSTEPEEPTKEGYIFDGWYTDSEFKNKYDFDTKVTKDITLYAKWTENGNNESNGNINNDRQEPGDDIKDGEFTADEWKNTFNDVSENSWYFDAVRYANENGFMSGVTDESFAPDDNITRGMFVTVLYRIDGAGTAGNVISFDDVASDSYYADAVIWAAENEIVKGIGETAFAPEENITREQIATVLHRYAQYKKYDVTVGENSNILSYADYDEISEYAIEALQYAVGSGLMMGKTETTLNPKDFATRAEIAAMIQRFIEGNK